MAIKDQRSLYMRILVVDDSEDGRDIAEAMLRAAGYDDVTTAASAADAYRFLAIGGKATQEPSSVDLVLLDILMPEIDGIEACARIREDPRYSDIPIIMVTFLADTGSLANAFVAGATDYITKPVSRVELLARVRSALKLKAELDRRKARELELTQSMSAWKDRRPADWIEDTTGLFVSEVAEAYLTAAANFLGDSDASVIALAVDGLDVYRETHGDVAAGRILEQVSRAVRATKSTVGAIAAAYRNGTMVLILPELGSKPALQLGEALRASVSRLGIANPESMAANNVTVSVVVATGRINHSPDRLNLLTRTISALPRVAAAGGNRVVPEYA
jgi:PleD family two-component response regulator